MPIEERLERATHDVESKIKVALIKKDGLKLT